MEHMITATIYHWLTLPRKSSSQVCKAELALQHARHPKEGTEGDNTEHQSLVTCLCLLVDEWMHKEMTV